MTLRYHADAEISEWHGHTLRFLKTLHDEYGAIVEIDRIDEQYGLVADFLGEVRYPTSEDVYECDLKRNRGLNQVTGQTPLKAFKYYGKLDIAGNIPVVDDGGTAQ